MADLNPGGEGGKPGEPDADAGADEQPGAAPAVQLNLNGAPVAPPGPSLSVEEEGPAPNVTVEQSPDDSKEEGLTTKAETDPNRPPAPNPEQDPYSPGAFNDIFLAFCEWFQRKNPFGLTEFALAGCVAKLEALAMRVNAFVANRYANHLERMLEYPKTYGAVFNGIDAVQKDPKQEIADLRSKAKTLYADAEKLSDGAFSLNLTETTNPYLLGRIKGDFLTYSMHQEQLNDLAKKNETQTSNASPDPESAATNTAEPSAPVLALLAGKLVDAANTAYQHGETFTPATGEQGEPEPLEVEVGPDPDQPGAPDPAAIADAAKAAAAAAAAAAKAAPARPGPHRGP